MNLDGKGILLDKKYFDGDWDYVWATRGTKSSVVITKYKCFEDGKLLKPSDWIIILDYDIKWGTLLYRDEKLEHLGI
jgi:hypothetical protein